MSSLQFDRFAFDANIHQYFAQCLVPCDHWYCIHSLAHSLMLRAANSRLTLISGSRCDVVWLCCAVLCCAVLCVGDPMANIQVHDFPLPRHGKDKEQIQSGNGFTVATIIVLAFAFIPASYARFVVAERQTKAKHQQLVSGVEGPAYWFSTYCWDLCNYLVPMVFSTIIILAFNNPSFVGVNLGTLMCCVVLCSAVL